VTREQAVEKLTAELLALAARYPVSGALKVHIRNAIEGSSLGLGRKRVWDALRIAADAIRYARTATSLPIRVEVLGGAAVALGIASISSGSFAYRVLIRQLGTQLARLEQEIVIGTAQIQATASA
jgi:hypothetical protein